MDAIRKEVSNFQVELRLSRPLVKTAVVTVALAVILASTLCEVQKNTNWKVAPFQGNMCPNLSFGALSVGFLSLGIIIFQPPSPIKITLKNHHYELHRRPLAKTCLTTLALMTITALSLKGLQKYTERTIVPLKGHHTANAFFGALSISYLAGSMFKFRPISRLLPEDMFPGLEGLSEAFLSREFEPLNGYEIREMYAQLLKKKCELAKSQEGFGKKLKSLLILVERESPPFLTDEIEKMIDSEEFAETYPGGNHSQAGDMALWHFVRRMRTHNLEKAREMIPRINGYHYKLLAIRHIALEMIERNALADAKEILGLAKAHAPLAPHTPSCNNIWIEIVEREAQNDPKVALQTAMSIEDPEDRAYALIEYAKVDPEYSLDEIDISWTPRTTLEVPKILMKLVQVAAIRDINQAIENILTLGGRRVPYQLRAKWRAEAYIEIAKINQEHGIILKAEEAEDLQRRTLASIGEVEDLQQKIHVFIKMAEVDPEDSLRRLKPLISQMENDKEKSALILQIIRIEAPLRIYDAIKTLLAFPLLAENQQYVLSQCVDAILIALAKKDPKTAVARMRTTDQKLRLLLSLIGPPVAKNVKRAARG